MTPHLWCQSAQRRGPHWSSPQQLTDCAAFLRRTNCRSAMYCGARHSTKFFEHTLWPLTTFSVSNLHYRPIFIGGAQY
jgi:hypothetical protein